MQRFEVEYFEKEDGTYPAEEFILSQAVSYTHLTLPTTERV